MLAMAPRAEERLHPVAHSTLWFRKRAARRDVEILAAEDRRYDADFYLLQTWFILEQYKIQLDKPLRRVFGEKREADDGQTRRWVREYVEALARLPHPRRVDAIHLDAAEEEDEPGECAVQTFFDARRSNMTQRGGNDKKSHFINCFNQYAGVQKEPLEPRLLGAVEARLDQYGLVDAGAASRADRFARVTQDHIRIILGELGKGSGQATAIYRAVTDRRVKDLDLLREKVLQDFDAFNELHSRKYSCTNSFKYQHLLYQFLQRHGHACDYRDFKFLKTTERKKHHEEMYKKIFAELQWNYLPMF